MSGKLIYIFALLTIIFMVVFFTVNPSYQKSLQAKYYYETSDYNSALTLAKEAFAMDVYNRMSSTIIAQSITALKYVKYIENAKRYMEDIDQIATHDIISDADKARIRLMCDIMIDSYIKLAPSVITDKKLINTSAEYFKKFENLREKVNR